MTLCNLPTIDLDATGKNICRLRKSCGYSVRQLADFLGFEKPQAIYKWQWGLCLPSVDNLLALSKLFRTSINDILVEKNQDVVPFYAIYIIFTLLYMYGN